MESIAAVQLIKNENYTMKVYIDSFNKRIRVDDLYGDVSQGMEKAEKIAKELQAEKLILKGRIEQFPLLIKNGFTCEAMIERYFLGSDMYFFCKYYTTERRTSSQWLKEDSITENVLKLEPYLKSIKPPLEYIFKKLTQEDADSLAALYQEVFQIYPTPLNDPHYIKETMNEGTIYYGFQYNGQIVSAASAEVNTFYKNAELTDCATLPQHRKHGLMKILLEKLESELKTTGVYCAYSIARSLSFGMNAALHQLGYSYRGRLTNNCFIFDKLEDMNVWVKDLSQK
ncbi:putative beta-lysine N-acetyltransferase [Bacillus sp. DTU_2020_1000418_1_SI_GHA_SEK_038]|uniref:putative beta-lysine N-acetyltransferase n=1 Tax=Bacillus sp. DTU_2020_1000418_1_SI_GHA_SEK_038 TaxID=3077585 RepID=UPI0028ED5B84|nr:putative beta-lysine N-acetyltransferase [Bacillus sp. DTU_2020_1000418_1_SI_GHA_SEK_038]WNS73893.1 putative beta-lysine N-acetyltransferase [Bacillus sp. DTU_2020_1000418_1_SI_GHA_SEK_038]